MYSIVMVAAMTVAPETPDFFHKSKGCYGCYGGCVGYSCGGCCGGWGWGCGGCCGGWGLGCGGCWGCHGYVTVSSCHGCVGCHGCYGGYALHGCCGGYAVPAAPPGIVGPPAVPGGVVPPPPEIPEAKEPKKTSADNGPVADSSLPANRGQVVVRVPASAKLFADGQATTLGGTERVFQTPDLVNGRDFQYTLKIEVTEGTATKSVTKQVLVRGGHRTVVDFTNEGASVSSPVTVSLPTKAKLFVDGVATTVEGGTHSFKTPELTRGKAYVYEFRAEIERNGKTEIETREVTFKAGDPVVVDFSSSSAVRTASAR